jgi:uncharacterized iron-regulated membrane protein
VFRAVVLTHRYVGIAVGILMAVWCLSGVVMMYVPYPRLTEEQRLVGLVPLDWRACCTFDVNAGASGGLVAGDARVSAFQLEMLGERPVLRAVFEGVGRRVIDVRSGEAVESVTDAQALLAAAEFAESRGIGNKPEPVGLIMRDQWTVAYNRGERPIHRFAFDDAADTMVYVSGTSGKVLQVTQSSQRFWNWLGAVPHWLYPTALRQHTAVWAQIVIWTSVIGTFLTVTGLYLGIKEIRRRQNGKLSSPHRGLMYWHHVPSLVFGVLVLSWTISGLFSMNPWGMMETQHVGEDMEALSGESPKWSEVKQLIAAVAARTPEGVVSLNSALFGGQLYAIASTASGARHRLDASGVYTPLAKSELDAAAARLQPDGLPASWSILETEDAYHYGARGQRPVLPVVLVVTGGDKAARYYLDPVSGRLVNKIDSGGKAFRWWHSGLHTFDFSSVTRNAWFRTSLMLPLLLGAAFVCATGTWLGIRRLAR